MREILLILDNIRSRENVGSIFRTADAVGVSRIYLCGITPQPPHPKIEKTALGAEKHVPYSYIRDTWRIVTKLKMGGYRVYGLEKGRGGKNIFDFSAPDGKSKNPIALVLGNEVNGLSLNILKRCDEVLYIPMIGKKESLNVSVSAGVALYQLALK